ncbi:MAG: 4Fe-4S binding protein [Candidatus Bathyarchaeum sp.]|nr:MAG: 4Fe-4S binding protein [Candidatus Bathyarchaeum sp.]
MSESVYKKLAKRLDAMPHGFPETKNGVELKLLQKIFTPEEAALFSDMRLTPESAEEIAQRTKRDPAKTAALLMVMMQKGQILPVMEGGQLKFSLLPFAYLGVYDSWAKIDEEFAQLFEQYYPVFGKRLLGYQPSQYKVVPVEKTIPFEVQVFPYEQASELLNYAKSFGVRNCICKTQKALLGEPCEYPKEVCLILLPIEGAFNNDPKTRVVTKEEALKILREAEEAGLIHSTANIREGHMIICNCCTCCCGIMRGISQLGLENSVAKSDFFVQVDSEICTGCETCVERCQFAAVSIKDNISSVDQKRCVGCGQCVMTCPSGAMILVRKPEDQITITPQNMQEWMIKRAKNRGISLKDIL